MNVYPDERGSERFLCLRSPFLLSDAFHVRSGENVPVFATLIRMPHTLLPSLIALLLLSACAPAPSEEAKFCGGIAALPCPEAYVCVDDPDDGCDPARGGADCGGMCVPR